MTTFEFAPDVGQETTSAAPLYAPPAQPFGVDVQPDRERVTVQPRGELDLATVDRLGACIDGLVDAGFDAVVLDLRRLTFLDSTGLCLIVRECQRPDLTIALIDGPQPVSRLFDLTGLREMLPFLTSNRLPLRSLQAADGASRGRA